MKPSDPNQQNKERLQELLEQLIAENQKLREEIARLKKEIEQLKRNNPRSAAPFSKNKPKENPKRPGRKPGQGLFQYRVAPSAADETVPRIEVLVSETHCPNCGGDLTAPEVETVTQTELPPLPQPEVKAYRVHQRQCVKCGHKVRGRHAEVSPDQRGATAHRLGPRAQAAAHLLYYGSGIPQRRVPWVLRQLTGLSVTQGALAQSALRLGTGDGPVAHAYRQLRRQIKEQEAIHTDDTGWRIGGRSAHLMVFESSALTVYQIRQRHRNEEVREVIGDDYSGTLCADRGRSDDAQELSQIKQQKCLSHLFRSIDQVLEHKTGAARGFGLTLKQQLKQALELYQIFHDPKRRLTNYDRCVRALDVEMTYHLRPRTLSDRDNQRLLDEIGAHHDNGNLLRFLDEPTTVEPTNNAAERALRPAVIARKVSQCSK